MKRIYTKYDPMTDGEIAIKIRNAVDELNYLAQMAKEENGINVEYVVYRTVSSGWDEDENLRETKYSQLMVGITKDV